MKLVLVCTAVVLLSSAGQLARLERRRRGPISEVFRRANTTPVPQKGVVLNYGDYEVTPGMQVYPEDVIGLPVLDRFKSKDDCYYTVIFRTIDWPSPNNSFLSPYLMGMSVNVQADSNGCLSLEQSDEIATWLNPSPPPGTGRHQYAVYILIQSGRINTANDKNLRQYQLVRELFSIELFAKTYNLYSPPAGGTVFYVEYPYSSGDRSDQRSDYRNEDRNEDRSEDRSEDWSEDLSEDRSEGRSEDRGEDRSEGWSED